MAHNERVKAVTYKLELFSNAKCAFHVLPRVYSTLEQAIAACRACSNDPFWKNEWIISIQNENFAVEVAGGVLNVTRVAP